MAAALARRSAATSTCCINHFFLLFRFNSPNSPSFYSSLHNLHFSTHKSPSTIVTPSFPEDFFIHKYQFSTQIASKAASFSARMRNPQNADLLLSFLRERGFSNSHLERIVRHYPQLLSACVETSVKPKFKIIEDLGFSAGEVAQVVARDFSILGRGADTIIHRLSVLKGLLGSNENVIKLIKKCHGLFYTDPEKTLLPNIEILKTCGVQIEQINSLIYTLPPLFLKSPENMRRCVQKADEMGVDRSSRMFIYSVKAVSTMSDETLELKLKSFRDLGFSEDDILRVFRTAPGVIAVSTRRIKDVKEVLLESGKYDMSCIIESPWSLCRSVEKRYKPRLEVLKVLERKSLITKWPGLSMLGTMTDQRFFERFVAPNMNEVGEDFIAKTAFSAKIDMPNH